MRALERDLHDIAAADIAENGDQTDGAQKVAGPDPGLVAFDEKRVAFLSPEFQDDKGPVPVRTHGQPEFCPFREGIKPAQEHLLDGKPHTEQGVLLHFDVGEKLLNSVGCQIDRFEA